jgi:hypothetical protein
MRFDRLASALSGEQANRRRSQLTISAVAVVVAALTRTGIVAVVAATRAIGTTMCLMIPPVQGHCQPGMIV